METSETTINILTNLETVFLQSIALSPQAIEVAVCQQKRAQRPEHIYGKASIKDNIDRRQLDKVIYLRTRNELRCRILYARKHTRKHMQHDDRECPHALQPINPFYLSSFHSLFLLSLRGRLGWVEHLLTAP